MHTICTRRCWSLALLQFVRKKTQIVHYKIFSNDFTKSPQLHCNDVSCNLKVDSLTFINFQENYQTAEIYFCSYHVTPLSKRVSNYCVN